MSIPSNEINRPGFADSSLPDHEVATQHPDKLSGASASNPRILMGIAGGTGSGKTTVAESIGRELAGSDVLLINQDNYYLDMAHLPQEERKKINYDHPDAFDWDLMLAQMDALQQGQAVEGPLYDFTTHTRRRETVALRPARVILLEGIMTLVDPRVRQRLDIKIYVDTDPDVRFIRRMERDVRERGRTLDSVIHQYLSVVRPMHMQFVEPTKRFADVIVPEGGFNLVAVDLIVTKIRAILSSA